MLDYLGVKTNRERNEGMKKELNKLKQKSTKKRNEERTTDKINL